MPVWLVYPLLVWAAGEGGAAVVKAWRETDPAIKLEEIHADERTELAFGSSVVKVAMISLGGVALLSALKRRKH